MKKKKITIRNFIVTAAVGVVMLLVLLIVSTLLASQKMLSTTDDAVSSVSSFYLEAMADHNSQTITNLIDSNFAQMEKAIPVIREDGIESQEELRAELGRIKALLSLSRFALVDEDNIVYTQYTTYTGGSRHAFLSEEKMDDRMISTVYLYGSSKKLCLAIPTKDLTIMGKRFRACFVQIDIKDIVDLLAFDDQGRTSFGLYSKNGGNLSATELGPIIAGQNLFDATKAFMPADAWDKMREDFAEEREGSMTFTSNGAAETLCYVPVKGTEWEMAVLIRESVIHEQIRGISENNLAISRRLIAFILVVMVVFAGVLLLQLKKIANEELKAEQEKSKSFRSMANTDSMTGVRNKHAYSEAEQALNRRIRENEIEKLGIVVCDINGLKHVNDTLGHAAGDKLIVDACNLICEYFTHGSVFRIGGDEFVVLLQGKGYDTMREVIDDLNRQIEENIAADAVVVSIGYSVLDKEDSEIRDIFGRADQMMYERKSELKRMGAKTRQD